MNNLSYKVKLAGLILTLLIGLHPYAAFGGEATLSWNPPVTNADGTPPLHPDGSPLNDLCCFNVYVSTQSGVYNDPPIPVGNTTSTQVTGLADGTTYFFIVTAKDVSGNESTPSNETSITLNPPPPPAPDISVSDSVAPIDDLQVNFGNVTVGIATHRLVTLTNNGNANLAVGNIGQANPLVAPFSISNDGCSGRTLAPSGNCSLTLRFVPGSPGPFNDTFNIPSNDPDESTVTFSLSGTGEGSSPSADAGGPYTVVEGQSITLDGSGSTDTDGTITLYEWDINNDGTYDYSSSSPTQSHIYVQHGTYTIRIRVTDNLGATDQATTTATVSDTSPAAGFTGSPVNGTSPLTVNFSNSSSGHDLPLTYGWDFDNNGTVDSTAQNPSYTYINPGTYTVKLTVTDSDGSSHISTRSNYITASSISYNLTVNTGSNGTVTSSPPGINCPGDCSEPYTSGNVVTLTATPQSGYEISNWTGCDSTNGNQCTLTMTSDATVTVAFALITHSISASAASGGSISPSGNISLNDGDSQVFAITPSMGYEVADVVVDGISQGAVTSYTFTNVTADHAMHATFETLNSSPSADAGGPYTVVEGQSITLDGSGSTDTDGTITLYEWDINNDGTYDYSSSSPNQSHAYVQNGTYTIRIRVTDNLGSTDQATTTATVSDTSPAAGFTGSPINGTSPLTVNFSNSSSGHDLPLTYGWDFDNNGTVDSTAQNPSYTYINPGTYTVKLTVTDSDGSSHISTRTNYITTSSISYNLTVNTGSNGNVTASPAGINCPGDCSESYASGSAITLTAAPQSGYAVSNWIGCDSTNGNQCTLTMTSDATVTVAFALITHSISSSAASGGSISPSGNISLTDGDYQVFAITPSMGYEIADVVVDGISQGAVTSYTFSSVSADHTIQAAFNAIVYELSCADAGSIECIERTNGGSDSDNLVGGMPASNIDYEFRVSVKDSTGSTPQYVRLYMAQRSNPVAGDFYAYDMNCTGDYSTGGLCTFTTKLGPAAVHAFYFEAKMSDNTIKEYPANGYITGPVIQLLNGLNTVGIPRDVNGHSLDGNAALGSSTAFRWDPDTQYYPDVTGAEPVISGEGYFIEKETNTLPELQGYTEISGAEFVYEIKPGWNLISNPYSGNVRINDIKVRKGNSSPVTWTTAVSSNWLTNAIYYYDGEDWGDTYSFETGIDATLVPWVGYWIYLNVADDSYYLVIAKP